MDRNSRERQRPTYRTVDETLELLLAQISPELRKLLEAKQNFKLTINGSAGHTFDVEVVKKLSF
jgi:hypothetical protein